ncbi:hypothetical protein KHA80_06935 [Anaerobacillus sp. HL2]|nr:hypothetical protein KHA80_06935 [Anaerobacillus sp. HL2]
MKVINFWLLKGLYMKSVLMLSLLNSAGNGWNVQAPHGGMFVWAKVPNGFTSYDFTIAAIKNGVIVTPGMLSVLMEKDMLNCPRSK